MEAVKNKVGVTESIKIIKYFNYDFEWAEISRENIEKIINKKKKAYTRANQKKEKNPQLQKKK